MKTLQLLGWALAFVLLVFCALYGAWSIGVMLGGG